MQFARFEWGRCDGDRRARVLAEKKLAELKEREEAMTRIAMNFSDGQSLMRCEGIERAAERGTSQRRGSGASVTCEFRRRRETP